MDTVEEAALPRARAGNFLTTALIEIRFTSLLSNPHF